MEKTTSADNGEHMFVSLAWQTMSGRQNFPLLTDTVGLPMTNDIRHYWKTISFIAQSTFTKEMSIVMRRLDDRNGEIFDRSMRV